MRIVFACDRFPPRGGGESATVALWHARELARRGHSVRVLARVRGPVGTLEGGTFEGLEVTFAPPAAFADLVEREASGADVVHVHHAAALGGAPARRLARRAPVVLSLHDLADCAPAERARRLRAEVAAARLVLVPSRTHLVRLARLLDFGPGQARILRPGLCLALAGRRRRPRPWVGEGPLRVLHPGWRSEAKGTLDLVRALGALPPGSAELVASGGGRPDFDARLRAAAGALPVELCGPCDGRELARAAATCHVAALPSRLPESYSLGVDEALALGLPVWTSAAAVARERFDGSVLTALPAGDPARWTSAFRDWLDDPALAREAFAGLPVAIPAAAEAAAALERAYRELTSPVGPTLPSPARHRRSA